MNLGQYIGSQVRQAIGGAWEDIKDEVGNVLAGAAKQGADEVIADTEVGQSGGIAGFFSDLPLIGGFLGDFASPLNFLLGKAGGVVETLALGYGLGSVSGEVMTPLTASVLYSAHRAAGDGRFDPSTAADMWVKGILTQGEAFHEAADQGFANSVDPNDPFANEGRIAQLYQAAQAVPGVEVLLEARRRNLIDDGQVQHYLQRLGFIGDWSGVLPALSRQLLSPADLALGWLRGDVDDATLNSYGATLGVDQQDMAVLVANTGEPPGTQELLEAYRRQIIDRPTLERGIRQSRVRNEWIPTLEALRFGPMSTAEAARAVVQNYMSDAQGQIIAAENGLDPTQWPFIRESYGRPLSRTEMSALFYRGLVSRAQFAQAMRESDVKDKYIGQAFDLGRRLIPERQITTAIAHGALDAATGVQYLMMQGYTQADAEVLVKTGTAEHHATLKDLSKTDITALYTDHLMSRDEAQSHLVKLGYTDQVARWILSLADARRQAQLARQLTSQIKALYQKKDVDRDGAITRLTEAGVKRPDAVALVDEWDIVHSTPSRTLSEAQIIKAAKEEVFTPPQAHDRLLGIGYDGADAHVLLRIAGFTDAQIDGSAPVRPPPAAGGPPATGPRPRLRP